MMDPKIYVPILVFLATQTGALVWFLASIKSEIKNLTHEVARITSSYITQEMLNEKLKRVHMRIDENAKDIISIQNECKLNHKGQK